MASLPSYQEAVRRHDWLDLVKPYFSVDQYAGLCLVCKRFYARFAPLLWNDPLRTARSLGLGADDDIAWSRFFIDARGARDSTRCMVLSWDTRRVGPERSDFFDLQAVEPGMADTLTLLPETFPKLRCLLLDGQVVDLVHLVKSSRARPTLGTTTHGGPLMLSVPHCQTELPTTFFGSLYLRSLVYLDISDMPGLLNNQLAHASLAPINLPCLRLLKMRGREMGDSTAMLLFRAFRDQLWSLDLGRNRLTDGIIDALLSTCFPDQSLKSETRFEVEGRIDRKEMGSSLSGAFQFVEESLHSALFNHPLRYFADAPVYTAEAHLAPQEAHVVRSEGRADIVDDDVECIKEALLGDERLAPSMDVGAHRGGISHLHLDGNGLSMNGLQRLVSQSPGQLQRLECGSVSFPLTKTSLPRCMGHAVTVSGCAGISHLFRPVFSPNLQALSIHHSLVTNVLAMGTGRLGTMADTWLSETFLFPNATLAYPLPFEPDMNPRLCSLALTGIPRYSCGPTIEGLIGLLKRASAQERAIEEARGGSVRRGPSMLRGLRHIRLEFQHDDASEELANNLSDSDGEQQVDSETLASMAAREFSFFGHGGWASSSATTTTGHDDNASHPRRPNPPPESSRLDSSDRPPTTTTHKPLSQAPRGQQHLTRSGTWNGRSFEVPVWIGPGIPGPHAAVNAYMERLAADPALLTDMAPASPCHVAAGVPSGSYIFSAAWNALVTAPPDDGRLRKPTRADLDGMRDVLAAIKAFRAQTRRAYDDAARRSGERVVLGAPHFHWTGRLEVRRP